MKDIRLPFLARPDVDSPTSKSPSGNLTSTEAASANDSAIIPLQPTTPTDGPSGESSRSEDRAAVDAETKPQDYVFKCFPDGSLFRYGAHPDGSGRQCLIDSTGSTVGVVSHKAIADFLVRGAHCLCCILRDEASNQDKQAGLVDSHGHTIEGQAVRPASSNIKLD